MADNANGEHEARVTALLEDNIRTEIDVRHAARSLGLTDDAVGTLAWAITAEIMLRYRSCWNATGTRVAASIDNI